jgi:hypothetical protein
MPKLEEVRQLCIAADCPHCGKPASFRVLPPFTLDGEMSEEALVATANALAHENMRLRKYLFQSSKGVR